MQVREGAVRGLDLHLKRLTEASITLFGKALADEQILSALRAAIRSGPLDVSLVATISSRLGEFSVADPDVPLQLLIRTSEPSDGPIGPLGLAAFAHERFLPECKHVGEGAKTWFLRKAAEQGLEDAVFIDRHGRLSEASIWNLAFRDGEAVVWPRADKLHGITMAIVQRQLERLGVPQHERDLTLDDLPSLAGAVVMNSWTPALAVSRIAGVAMPEARPFVDLLRGAYQAEPWVVP